MTSQILSRVDGQGEGIAARSAAGVASSAAWAAARAGATLCVALDLVYAFGFMLYALARSAPTVLSTINADAGVMGTLVATWAALVVAAALVAALLAIPVALLGSVTAVIIWGAGRVLNPRGEPARAVAIGMGVCVAVMALIHGMLRASMNFAPVDLLSPHALYWIELPGLIFVIAGGILGRRLLSARSG